MSVLSTSKVPQTWNESWWWVLDKIFALFFLLLFNHEFGCFNCISIVSLSDWRLVDPDRTLSSIKFITLGRLITKRALMKPQLPKRLVKHSLTKDSVRAAGWQTALKLPFGMFRQAGQTMELAWAAFGVRTLLVASTPIVSLTIHRACAAQNGMKSTP